MIVNNFFIKKFVKIMSMLFLLAISKINADISIYSMNAYSFPVNATQILKTVTKGSLDLQSGITKSVPQRISEIAAFVKEQNPDVVFFQELWGDANKQLMIKELGDKYPNNFFLPETEKIDFKAEVAKFAISNLPTVLQKLKEKKPKEEILPEIFPLLPIKLDSGLLVMSKNGFDYKKSIVYDQRFDDDSIARKGALIVVVNDKNGKPVILANTHLQSGTALRAINIAVAQLRQLARELKSVSQLPQFQNAPIILMGDLNQPIFIPKDNQKRLIDRTSILADAFKAEGIDISNDNAMKNLEKKYGTDEIVFVDEPAGKAVLKSIDGTQKEVLPADHPIVHRLSNDLVPRAYFPNASEPSGTQLLDHLFTGPNNDIAKYQIYREFSLGDQGANQPYNGAVARSDHAGIMAEIKT